MARPIQYIVVTDGVHRRTSYFSTVLFILTLCVACANAGWWHSLSSFVNVRSTNAIYSVFQDVGCMFGECCNTDWKRADLDLLQRELKQHVHGQHIAKTTVFNAIRDHVRNGGNSDKALVLSLHGYTGSGKNYISNFVSRALYREERSSYVHTFVSTIHFPHDDDAELYQLELQQWIRGNVSKCEFSVFIIDEIDKMPSRMLDAIKPFFDSYSSVQQVNYRNAIFIFLSNTGSKAISAKTYQAHQLAIDQEKLDMIDFQHLIKDGAFNEHGGLQHTRVITKALVDYYVPFMPMERRHVILCIKDEVARQGRIFPNAHIEKMADELEYFPKDTQLYATTGCRTIKQLVRRHMWGTRDEL